MATLNVTHCKTCKHPLEYPRHRKSKGFCSRACYQQSRVVPDIGRAPTLSDITPRAIERFWGRVQRGAPDECWEIAGHRDQDGYGSFKICIGQRRAPMRAHRVAYFLHYGDDPGALQVCHHCDNPPCCNPHHLFKGTCAENLADMYAKGRGPTGLRNGSATKPESITRGERVNTARLKETDIPVILSRLARGDRQVDIARDYNIVKQAIYLINKGKTWKHIPRPLQ